MINRSQVTDREKEDASMKLLPKLTAIFDRTIDLLAWLASGLLLFATFSIFFDVIFRYFLNRPIIWVLEISEYILLWITFLGAAWLLKIEGHVRVDIAISQLKARGQALLNTVTSVIGAMMCLALAWYGALACWDFYQRGHYDPTQLDLPTFILISVIPAGSFLLFIQFLRRANGNLRSWKSLKE